jgi:hypothetical protein
MQLTSSHKNVQNNPRRPNINLRATILHRVNLRRDIRRRAAGRGECALLAFMFEDGREAEICDFEVAVGVQEYIFRFEIAVADAAVV